MAFTDEEREQIHAEVARVLPPARPEDERERLVEARARAHADKRNAMRSRLRREVRAARASKLSGGIPRPEAT